MSFYSVFANESAERRTDFKRHKVESEKYDEKRVRGLGAYLDSVEESETKRLKGIKKYRDNRDETEADHRQKRIESFHSHREADDKWKFDHERARVKYIDEKKEDKIAAEGDIDKSLTAREDWAQFEMEELDLISNRPRYNYKARIAQAGQGKNRKAPGASAGPAPSAPGGQQFDEFGDGSGGGDNYFPPPPSNFPPDDAFDDIPPPPPPPPGFDNNMGDFPPPPPPPPPGFDGVDF